jgi:hypothetical protein
MISHLLSLIPYEQETFNHKGTVEYISFEEETTNKILIRGLNAIVTLDSACNEEKSVKLAESLNRPMKIIIKRHKTDLDKFLLSVLEILFERDIKNSLIWRYSGSSGKNEAIKYVLNDNGKKLMPSLDKDIVFKNERDEYFGVLDILSSIEGTDFKEPFNWDGTKSEINIRIRNEDAKISNINASTGSNDIQIHLSSPLSNGQSLVVYGTTKYKKRVFNYKKISGYYTKDILLSLNTEFSERDEVAGIILEGENPLDIRKFDVKPKLALSVEEIHAFQIVGLLMRFDVDIDSMIAMKMLKTINIRSIDNPVPQLLNALNQSWKPSELRIRNDLLVKAAGFTEGFFDQLAKNLGIKLDKGNRRFLKLGKLLPAQNSVKPNIIALGEVVTKVNSFFGKGKKVRIDQMEDERLAEFNETNPNSAHQKWIKFMTNPVFETKTETKTKSSSDYITERIGYGELPFIISFFLRNGASHKPPIQFLFISQRQDWFNTGIGAILSVFFWILYQTMENDEHKGNFAFDF